MKIVHTGMRLDEENWQRAVGFLTAALDSFDVPDREMAEVLTLVESTQQEIVETRLPQTEKAHHGRRDQAKFGMRGE